MNKKNWKSLNRGVFLINSLAIIFDGSKVLIGKRETPDPYVPELTWSFPGGRPTYDKSLENSLKNEIMKKTSIHVEIKGLYHARLFPTKPEFLFLYYIAKPKNIDAEAGEKFVEVKWVKPTEVSKYFSTPIDIKIKKLLNILGRNPSYVDSILLWQTND